MDRTTALEIIRKHEAELRALGVAHLSMFGSTARGEATTHSDIDIAVQLEGVHGGFATFGRLDRIRDMLAALTRVRVDVIPEPKHGPVKDAIDRDRCHAF